MSDYDERPCKSIASKWIFSSYPRHFLFMIFRYRLEINSAQYWMSSEHTSSLKETSPEHKFDGSRATDKLFIFSVKFTKTIDVNTFVLKSRMGLRSMRRMLLSVLSFVRLHFSNLDEPKFLYTSEFCKRCLKRPLDTDVESFSRRYKQRSPQLCMKSFDVAEWQFCPEHILQSERKEDYNNHSNASFWAFEKKTQKLSNHFFTRKVCLWHLKTFFYEFEHSFAKVQTYLQQLKSSARYYIYYNRNNTSIEVFSTIFFFYKQ